MQLLRTPRRIHIAKTLSWRVVATSTTFLLSWLFTGSVAIGLAIGGSEALIKMLLYYAHERAWFRFTNK